MSRLTNINESAFDSRFSELEEMDYLRVNAKMGNRDKKIIQMFRCFGIVGKDCLDIGPGSGRWLQFLRAEGAGLLSAADISDVALANAENLGARTQKLDLEYESLRFEDDSFDIVYSFMVLEHIRDPRLFLTEVLRVCRPGGLILFTIPNIVSLQSRIRILFGRLPLAVSQDPTHVKYYSPRSLKKLFDSFNARVEIIPTSFSVHPLNRKMLEIPSNRWTAGLDDHRFFRVIARP